MEQTQQSQITLRQLRYSVFDLTFDKDVETCKDELNNLGIQGLNVEIEKLSIFKRVLVITIPEDFDDSDILGLGGLIGMKLTTSLHK